MKNIENKISRQIRNTKIQRVILRTLMGVGILSVALLAPNALQMLKVFGLNKNNNDRNIKRSISRSRDLLVKKGLVKYVGHNLTLTEKGKEIISRLEKYNYNIEKPKKWDGKWRIVIFDIKEFKKEYRDNLRKILIQIGFIKLQNSVWVYPYNCENLVNLIKADFKIGKEVLYVVADEIENDKFIRKHFGLG